MGHFIQVPPIRKDPKYYVVKSETQAFSGWDTLEEAHACIGRFVLYNPMGFIQCKGIVVVDDFGRRWHFTR